MISFFNSDGSSDSEFKKVVKPKTPSKPVKTEPVTTSTPPIRRGRGRPRKYPLPDSAQKTPEKKSDAPKVTTRKQSSSNSMSRVSKLLSTIRNATDTESDGDYSRFYISKTYLLYINLCDLYQVKNHLLLPTSKIKKFDPNLSPRRNRKINSHPLTVRSRLWSSWKNDFALLKGAIQMDTLAAT